MAVQRINPDIEFFNLLGGLSKEARAERLECAVVLLDALASALTDHRTHSAPPGFLTVDGWIHLLNRWEEILKSTSKRHVDYSRSFFKDVINRSVFKAPPMSPLLAELLTLMENYAEPLDSRAAA